jgi:hypothetical protein
MSMENFGGMRIGRGNRSTRRKPAPVPLHPPQIPHDGLGSNPGSRGGKPAINRLGCGTAAARCYLKCEFIQALYTCTLLRRR